MARPEAGPAAGGDDDRRAGTHRLAYFRRAVAFAGLAAAALRVAGALRAAGVFAGARRRVFSTFTSLPARTSSSRDSAVSSSTFEREGQLRDQDLAGPGEHALLPGGEALVGLPQRQVPHHLGDLVDVAALELLDVVLEPAGPVGRHPRLLLAEDGEHLLDLFVVDDVAQPDLLGLLDRDRDLEVPVGDAEHEVVGLVPVEDPLLLAFDDRSPVVGVDDFVTDGERHGRFLARAERRRGKREGQDTRRR